MSTHRYKDKDVIVAVKNSNSYRGVLNLLGLREAGGNHATIKRKIESLKCDTSHFHGQAWNKGKKTGPKRNILDYLKEKSDGTITSHALRLRLIREGFKKDICESCNLSTWLNKPISLELDHKNGVHSDNRIENLQILCPNCHAQTSNYRGKNKKFSGERDLNPHSN